MHDLAGLERIVPDEMLERFGKLLSGGTRTHVWLLHSAGLRSDYIVNGKTENDIFEGVAALRALQSGGRS